MNDAIPMDEEDWKVQGLKSKMSQDSGSPNEEGTGCSSGSSLHLTGVKAKSPGTMDFLRKLKNEGSPKEKGQI